MLQAELFLKYSYATEKYLVGRSSLKLFAFKITKTRRIVKNQFFFVSLSILYVPHHNLLYNAENILRAIIESFPPSLIFLLFILKNVY